MEILEGYDYENLPEEYCPKSQHVGYTTVYLIQMNISQPRHSYITNFNFPDLYDRIAEWEKRVFAAFQTTTEKRFFNRDRF